MFAAVLRIALVRARLGGPLFATARRAPARPGAEAGAGGQPARARRLAHEHMQSIVATVTSQDPELLARTIDWG